MGHPVGAEIPCGYHPHVLRGPGKAKQNLRNTSFSHVKHVDMFWRENHPAAVEKSEYFFLKKFLEKNFLKKKMFDIQ